MLLYQSLLFIKNPKTILIIAKILPYNIKDIYPDSLIYHEKNIDTLNKYDNNYFDLIIVFYRLGYSKKIEIAIRKIVKISNNGYIVFQYLYHTSGVLSNYKNILQIINNYNYTQFDIIKADYNGYLDKIKVLLILKIRQKKDIINNAWENKPCIVMGNGNSLNKVEFKTFNKYNTIGCNLIIEDYKPTWFICIHHEITKDIKKKLKNYSGKVFIQNRDDNIIKNAIRFNLSKQITSKIENGLYFNKHVGTAMINLAILAGANPIYLIGIDGCIINNQSHYRKDYSNYNLSTIPKNKNYIIKDQYNVFKKYKDRIFNLSMQSKISTFNKIQKDL